MSTIVRGDNVLVEFYQSGNWFGYACARSCSFSSSTELIETSVTGSGKFKHFTPTVNSFSGNIDGITSLPGTTTVDLFKLRQYQLGHVLQRIRFKRLANNGNSYTDNVEFFITNVTDTSSFDNISTFTVELQGTGVLGQTIIQPPIIITAVKRYEYTAVGGELGFTDALLIGKDIISVSKNGLDNAKLITTGSPASKEVKYTIATGTFLWAIEFETAGEVAVILYQDL